MKFFSPVGLELIVKYCEGLFAFFAKWNYLSIFEYHREWTLWDESLTWSTISAFDSGWKAFNPVKVKHCVWLQALCSWAIHRRCAFLLFRIYCEGLSLNVAIGVVKTTFKLSWIHWLVILNFIELSSRSNWKRISINHLLISIDLTRT